MAIMGCDILVSKANAQLLAGRIMLNGRDVSAWNVAKGYEKLIESVLDDPIKVNGRQITAQSDPEQWFRALPEVFNGTYLRARFVTPTRKFNENHDEQGRFAEADAGAAAIYGQRRDEYAPWKENMTDAERDTRYARQDKWEQSTLGAISEGKLDPAAGIKQGLGSSYTVGWKPLPETLYHVTTNADAVEATGLKSRYELSQREGTGLGGGSDKSISFTTDPKVAEAIHSSILEAHDVASGKITAQDLLDQAAKGEGAARPWIKETINWDGETGGRDWNPGQPYPAPLRSLLEGQERQSGWPKSQADMPGWTPDTSRGNSSWMGGNNTMVYQDWVRPDTKENITNRTFDFYKTFAAAREHAGGPMNPLFFSSDTKALAAMSPSSVATMQFKANPGSMGMDLQGSGLGEWRTYSGKAVKFVGRVKKFNDAHDERGRFASSDGGGGTGGTGAAEEVPVNTRQWTENFDRNRYQAMAAKLGFNPDKVKIDYTDKAFKVDGVDYIEGGHADRTTGEVTFNPNRISPESERGIVAHEVAHTYFEKSMKDYKDEHSAWVHGPNPGDYNAMTTANGNMLPTGQIPANLQAKWPAIMAWQPIMDKSQALYKQDGVSDYSKQYWSGWFKGEVPTDSAMHETIAEMARIKQETGTLPGTPLWQKFYKATMKGKL